MRRRPLQRLTNLGRLLLLAASLLGMGVAVVWTQAPGWVEGTEAWLRQRLVGACQQRFDRAVELAATDPAGARALLTSLLDDLGDVRQLDRLHDLAGDTCARLLDWSERDGDQTAIDRYARRLVALDDQDLPRIGRAGGLLGRELQTRKEALAMLQRAWQLVPGNPMVAKALLQTLLADGNYDAVCRVIAGAAAAPRSRRWNVHWESPGYPADPERNADFTPRSRADGMLEAEFTIVDWISTLVFRLPTEASFELVAPTLDATSAIGRLILPLAEMQPELQGINQLGDTLIVDGDAAAQCTIRFAPAPKQRYHFMLRAGLRPTVPIWLRQALLGPHGDDLAATAMALPTDLRAAVQELRRQALTCLTLEVFYSAGNQEFAIDRQVRLHVPGTLTAEGVAFTARASLPGRPQRLRFDFPDQVRASYRLLAIQLLDAGGAGVAQLDPAAGSCSPDLVQQNGWWRAVGDDPYLVFTVPAGVLADGFCLQGVAR